MSSMKISSGQAGAVATILIAIGLMTFAHGVDEHAFGFAGAPANSIRAGESYDGPLSFEDRVRYQRRIDEVYWRHRIWPAQNPAPKPALDEVLPDVVIRERVATYLDKSAALEVLWSRPLTGEQLLAELNRMVRDTKNPDLLRELFAALDDDPFLVAECLARPLLTERLTRNWYARDARFHGALRERAEAVLADRPNDASRMSLLGGKYAETEWCLDSEEPRAADLDSARPEHAVIDLSVEEWRERIGYLAALFGVKSESEAVDNSPTLLARLPLGRVSGLVDEGDRFVVTALLSIQPDRLRTATVTWNKRPFKAWWAEEGRAVVESTGDITPVSPPSGGYDLQSPLDDGCTEDSWTVTSTGDGVPTGRVGAKAVWTGTEMIVWGGLDGGYVNTGGRFDPATDSWTPVSMGAGVPTARLNHTAVWTGTEMIIWGGWDGGEKNSGGRYDPLTDSWTPTSEGTDVPTKRYFHTAVWTGTEMIVWGGYPGLETGARYDALNDSWTAASAASSVPTGRSEHVAVWTGKAMVIWGGRVFSGFSNTGGSYEPLTDSWTETSTGTFAPTPRAGSRAVWTGTEMIVWGGYHDYGEYMNTGGRYDPLTDSWTGTSTGATVPTGRAGHTAVWTGAEMIVWGGHGSAKLNSGGRYAALSGLWAATSTGSGVPTARYGQSAVWTGTQMIVWGGNDDSYVNSGGLYCACGGNSVGTWYPDADGDGYGSDSTGIPSCSQPPGYIATGGDCDDTNVNIYSGAQEINDGLDNQCPGDHGHGLVDEIAGVCGFFDAQDKNRISWPAQPGATDYEVARSTDPQFGADCLTYVTSATYWDDGTPVPVDSCFHYLVRATQPNLGSWGANSVGVERTPACP